VLELVWQGPKSCVLSAKEGEERGDGNPPPRANEQREEVNSE
jgi:hypothetical protein